MRGRSAVRSAFTLFDLLVLLAMSGLVLAYVPPALLKARDAAQDRDCVNNLETLAIAAQDYHAVHQRLPPGWLGAKVDGKQPGAPDSPSMEASMVGVLVQLLPFCEQDKLWDQLYCNWDVNAWTQSVAGPNRDARTGLPYIPPTNVAWWEVKQQPTQASSNLKLAETRIKTLMCPLDDSQEATEGTIGALSIYSPAPGIGKDGKRIDQVGVEDMDKIFSSKKFPYDKFPEAKNWGRTNYVGVCGTAGWGLKVPISAPNTPKGITWDMYEGVFYNRSRTTLDQIAAQDGTSNTLMFGEVLGGLERSSDGKPPERKTFFSWFCGALPTLHGLPPEGEGPWNSFGSRHPRGVPFAWADGSVRFIKRGQTAKKFSEDWWVLQELAGKRDGGLRNPANLLD